MSSPNILYSFDFNSATGFDESVFSAAGAFATGSLRATVQDAIANQMNFLQRFPKVNKIAQQVQDGGDYFKVGVTNANFTP